MDNNFSQDWDRFLREAGELEKQVDAEAVAENPNYNPEQTDDPVVNLNTEQARVLCNRISGKKGNGEAKAKIGYISYVQDIGDPTGEEEAAKTYTELPNTTITVLPYFRLPELFYTVDIVFPSSDCEAIKKFWANFEQYRKKELSAGPTELPVFYVNAQEDLSPEELKETEEIMICGITNPMLAYITRSNPGQPAEEIREEDGTLLGGNIIRMLVPSDNIVFQFIDKENFDILSDSYEDEWTDTVPEESSKEKKRIESPEELLNIPPGYYDMDEE